MFSQVTLNLFDGFWMTLKIFLLTLAFALPLGLIISFGSMCRARAVKWVIKTVNWVATWQCFDRFLAVIIAFVINYACYFSEIYRGGIESVPAGQYEACQVLGMKKSQVFFKVVLMQVIKRIVPPISNEIITLVKDTSLSRTIMVYEIIWNAQKFIKSDGLLWPLFYTAVYYLVFCGILTLLFGYIEKKLDYYKG